MGLPEPNHPGYTLKEWERWEGRWELIRGIAFDMTPAPNTEHQEILTNMAVPLGTALTEARRRSGGNCKLFMAPTDVYLEEPGKPPTVVQPDLLVVCDPAKLSKRGIEGAPDLVVEILSPATAAKDWTRKRWLYEAAGVKEYLIIDPEDQVSVLLVLEDGHYRETARVEWGAEVEVLNGAIRLRPGSEE